MDFNFCHYEGSSAEDYVLRSSAPSFALSLDLPHPEDLRGAQTVMPTCLANFTLMCLKLNIFYTEIYVPLDFIIAKKTFVSVMFDAAEGWKLVMQYWNVSLYFYLLCETMWLDCMLI